MFKVNRVSGLQLGFLPFMYKIIFENIKNSYHLREDKNFVAILFQFGQ